MSKWRVQFDGQWVMANDTIRELHRQNYGVAAHKESDVVYTYSLWRLPDDIESERPTVIVETRDKDELNRYVNLILGPKE